MVRGEMLARMSSLELSHWLALARVQHEEFEEAHDRAESPDGQVVYHGREDTSEDDEGTDGDV
jgi:hypothetical protein